MIPEGRFVDLTITYDDRMEGVSFEDTKILNRDGWNAKTIKIYAHSGTHMDAPHHFGVSDKTINEYQPSDFIGKAHILRLSIKRDSYLISVSDLDPVINKFKPGDSLLIGSGWSEHLYKQRYRDGLPRISEEVAQCLVNHKIKMLGVEPPSIADVNNLDEVTRIHRILMAGDVTIIEGLTNIDQLQKDICTVFAFPLKIKGGDGSPARVIALEGKEI
ncbi:cyclase family protein [Aliifodinibius sp. S!AR15-10]|uniref:cyclase family protein n=1 Tax=Aliifodinibius sp. S!AR15-10 TaxID=2950437 RepID=UPI002858481B|nr:cyclase family protein [Aliifodinibius sp. S!AR15-10]MDR8389701.1 cyclase family protein [Aliifodinibius sp. S!AR15-10]